MQRPLTAESPCPQPPLALVPVELPGLSIVLPCLDEAANLAAMARDARETAERVAAEHEVIVVDDGSRDGTLTIARALAAADPGVRVLVHDRNRGYGAAVRTGFQAARMPWVFLVDADRQFDLRQLDDFVPSAATHDVIAGRRVQRADPLIRRAAAHAWNVLVRLLFDVPVHDVDCAFKLVRREVLSSFELTADGAMVSTELIVKLVRAGARIEERGVVHMRRSAGKQSGLTPPVIARALRELVVVRRALRTTSE